jgi:hypothetical protein
VLGRIFTKIMNINPFHYAQNVIADILTIEAEKNHNIFVEIVVLNLMILSIEQ